MPIIWNGTSFAAIRDDAVAKQAAIAARTSAPLAAEFMTAFTAAYGTHITAVAKSLVENTAAFAAAGTDLTRQRAAALHEAARITVWIENPTAASVRLKARNGDGVEVIVLQKP
jgi:hypothetical protein